MHGVHRGAYLDKPEEIVPPFVYDYSGVIFPQDIRNCTKCHSDSERYTEAPSRLACMACHDSDDANAHAAAMTIDPTPNNPFNGDETATCITCHGPGKEFAVTNVHNITDPFVFPYPR